MVVYRIAKRPYCRDLSGQGARLFGGRWNSVGVPILYTAESRALAAMELAVHTDLSIKPKNLMIVSLQVPEQLPIEEVNHHDLPEDWNTFPYIEATKTIGDAFVKRQAAPVLQAPSAVIQGDFNYLLNPAHPRFSAIELLEVAPFEFEMRL